MLKYCLFFYSLCVVYVDIIIKILLPTFVKKQIMMDNCYIRKYVLYTES